MKERSGRDGLRLPKQYKRLVDGVRTQIPQHSGCGLVGALAPCVFLGLKAEAVEARFVFDDIA